MITWGRISPAILAWAAIGVFALLLGGYGLSEPTVQGILASAGLAHSVAGFWSDGRQRISAPSIYFFASGLFIFFPGIYLAGHDPTIFGFGEASLVPVLAFCYFSQLLMHYLFWSPRKAAVVAVESATNRSVARWGIWMGLLLVSLGVGLSITGRGENPLVNAASYSGVALVAVASLRGEKRVSLFGYALIGAAFLAYMQFLFTGFGRLGLGSLALCIAMAGAHRWRGHFVKGAILIGITPALLYFARSRVEFTATLNPAQSDNVNGLESVLSPLVRFAQLLEMVQAGDVQLTYFKSFYATAVIFVPRRFWPEKPVGLGAELAQLFRPELQGTGHSELALFHGEWLLALGIAGLVVMVPAVALLVRWMDSVLIRSASIPMLSHTDLLKIVAIIIASASIVDLVWGGTFTYIARVAARLLILVVLYALVWHHDKDMKSGPAPPERDLSTRGQPVRRASG
ncbi:hypothetical protein GA707_14645 [Nostocoides sp. F2B08]|uniref:hypothetical protein n=1 Tax=Nostocoides sp. F2B08 TaxID=2653936 RepID=UPI001262E521|nr:hypothetical protein [Tetrasphaera sp. F2B08]KAB7743333.1 hypothetical protein GA707_14645 [Tetrasphaera sp. F2B08]